MTKRLFDLAASGLALLVLAPVLAVAALGVRVASPGPILYRAARAGRHGRPFTMYKLRTMRHGQAAVTRTRITAVNDPRVFRFGRLLRRTKIDELPQLLNVLRGEMSIVGPRPEDPEIVARHYAAAHRDTLVTRPGLSSPGTLYHDTHCTERMAGDDPVRHYLEDVLPVKAALDLIYVRRASLGYDLAIIARTVWMLVGRLVGRRRFADPPELEDASGLIVPALTSAPALRPRRGATPRPAGRPALEFQPRPRA
jgi:lipopolysaccharide/colanic/teichoic acid biosynthesis glycosyltransferase